ncbi:MAG: zinc ribbon domain-containing protein [Methanomassiliicoccales archaeon]|nr:zinc ribbon domain-containing protein [Methanomassiliicoccales archaeon]
MNGKDAKRRGVSLRTIYLITYVAVIILAAAILLPTYWYLWAIVLAICLLRIAAYLVPRKAYRCSKCGTVFAPRTASNLRPNVTDVYEDSSKLKCPKCGSTDVALVKKGSGK